MSKKKWKSYISIFTIFILLGTVVTVKPFSAKAEESDVNITLLGTSDIHGRFMPWDYASDSANMNGSLTQLHTIIKKVRQENPNTILLDAGDMIQGNSAELFNDQPQSPMMVAMNTMGYDAWAFGDHEFNFGLDILKKVSGQYSGKILAGNIYKENGERFLPAYTIVERDGIKIGVIGMDTPMISDFEKGTDHLAGLVVKSPVEETKKAIQELKGKVDAMVGVMHMGLENENGIPGTGVQDIANECPELSAIFAGHMHKLVKKEVVNGVIITEPDKYGTHISRVDLTFSKQNGKVVLKDKAATAIPVKNVDGTTALSDSALEATLTPLHEYARKDANVVVAELEGKNLVPENGIKDIPSVQIQEKQVGESTVNLRILETSDIHVNLMNYDYYQTKTDNKVGLVQTATLVNEERAKAKNSVLFDDGDALQGTPLGDYVAHKGLDGNYVHPLYRIMNLMKYDVISLGNHEFNYGLDYLKKAISKTQFPVINSNVFIDDHDNNEENDKHAFEKYHIFDKVVTDEAGNTQTVKIGVMGFVPPQIMGWDKANLEGKVKAKDIVETANKLVPEMKAKGADIIVALAHSGVDKNGYNAGMENASYYLATKVPGVDAVLMGHSHTVITDKFNDVPVVMPGVFGSNLGIIDMELKKVNGKWEVQKDKSVPSVRPISDSKGNALVESDKRLVDEIKDDHEATIKYVNTPVGKTTAPINSYFSLVQDDPSVQLVTNAQKWYVEKLFAENGQYSKYKGIPVLSAGAPFKAGGRNGATYYTDIPAGTLAIKNVADLYVYPNTLYAVKVKGAQVKEWLEMSAGQFNQIDPAKAEEQSLVNINYPTYNFDILDGVKYEIDVTQPAKYDKDGNVVNPNTNRIVNLTYDGKPIADNQEFIVATNNYRGSSKTFPGVSKGEVVYQSQDETRQIIVKYMQETPVINPAADQNWTFKPIVAEKLNTTFDSSPNAQKYIAQGGKISYVGPSENEFAKYAIDLTKKKDEGNDGDKPTTPPTTDGGNNGDKPTTPDNGNKDAKEPTNVSGDKETSKVNHDLPKTGTGVFTTIAVGLALIGAGMFMLFRRKKANR